MIRRPPLLLDPARLPPEFLDGFSRLMHRFLAIESASGAALLVATITALGLSNSPWAHAYLGFWETSLGVHFGSVDFTRALREWINDGLMTLFFFLVALELKRELVLGELRDPRLAALSVAGAVGGMIAPAALYLAVAWGHPGASGWGTVMATDTAFVLGCLALLGRRVPPALRTFMLSLAIVDDLGAILIVAIGYSADLAWGALGLAAAGLIAVRGLALTGVRSVPAYVCIGVLVWLAIDASGIHATVTGVLMGLLTPARRWVNDERLYAILGQVVAHPDSTATGTGTPDRGTLQIAETAARESLSPVERLEILLHPWIGFALMPLFALANAGVSLSFGSADATIVIAVVVAFAVGKPAGILACVWVAARTGVARRPPELSFKVLAGGALLAGIGFTMALFIAHLSFPAELESSAKLGIFAASLLSASAGIAVLALGTRGRTRGPGAL